MFGAYAFKNEYVKQRWGRLYCPNKLKDNHKIQGITDYRTDDTTQKLSFRIEKCS
jgi:hypothetical protein